MLPNPIHYPQAAKKVLDWMVLDYAYEKSRRFLNGRRPSPLHYTLTGKGTD